MHIHRAPGYWKIGVRHLATVLRNRVSEQLSVAESQGELRGVTSIRLQLLSQTQPQGPCPPAGTAVRQRAGNVLMISLA